jgi:o-succinylbenzoate---CoA ligase
MSHITHAQWIAGHLTLPFRVHIPGQDTSLSTRRIWTLDLHDSDGHRGRGIAAPLAGFSAEGADEVEGALRTLCDTSGPLVGTPVNSLEAIHALVRATQCPASVMHAVEQALLDLLASRRSTTVCALLGGVTDALPYHALISDPWSAQLAIARGAAAIKVKVGGGHDALQGVQAIRDAVGPQVQLHLDVNGGWSLEEALDHLPQLEALGVALIEEPLAERDLLGMAQLCQATAIVIAADESCRTAADLDAILALGAADAVVLKPMLIGGVLRTSALAHRAAEAGKEVIITHCLDGPLGQASALLAGRLCPQGALRTVSHEAAMPGEVGHPVATAAEALPDQVALICGPGSLTYRELADRAAQCAGWLAAQGVRAGQTVALRGPTTLDWAVAFHGICWLGAIPAPLDPHEHTAQQGVTLRALRPHAVVGAAPDGPWQSLPWPDVTRSAPGKPTPWRLSEPRVLMTTSGTTGAPRPISLTTEQLVCSAMGSRARLGHEASDRWLCCLPVHHVGGLSILVRSAFNRTTVVLEPRFEAERVAQHLATGGATVVSLVPTMLTEVLDALDQRPLSDVVRAVLLGGAAAPEDLLERCDAQHIPVARTWGMTEAGSQVATAAPGDFRAGLPPLPLTEVTAPGAVLTVQGRLVGAEALTTGDRGWLDASGRVHVMGRRDRVIISGGENLDGAAIEAALSADPAIAEACVVAQPDPKWGQRPAALLVATDPAARPQRAVLRRRFAEHMASYAFPSRLCWVDALPKTALGKASLRRVTERLERLAETIGDLERSEALHVDTRVDMLSSGSKLTVICSEDLEIEGDGRVAKAPHGDLDDELLTETHGPGEVGLSVDERHAPAFVVEDLGEGIVERDEQGLIRRMAILKDTPKEGDPSTIDLEKAHGETMFEGHKDSDGRTR